MIHTSQMDPSRLVTCASGWTDHPIGHVVDVHTYPGPVLNLFPEESKAKHTFFYFTFLILHIYIFVSDLCCRSEKSSSCWRNVGTKQGYSWTHLVIYFSIDNFGSKPQILRYGNDFILPDPRGSIETEDQFLKEYEDKIK